MNESAPRGALDCPVPDSPGPRRSVETPRGLRRRRALLDAITDDLERNGLVDFTLRRAARAAGTAHKVLIYHFGSFDALLVEALRELRSRRLARVVPPVTTDASGRSLSELVAVAWRELVAEGDGPRVLDQASGLSLYDPQRYTALGRDATEQYLRFIETICPADWTTERRQQVSALILAVLRGLLLDQLTSGDTARTDAALDAFRQMIEAAYGGTG